MAMAALAGAAARASSMPRLGGMAEESKRCCEHGSRNGDRTCEDLLGFFKTYTKLAKDLQGLAKDFCSSGAVREQFGSSSGGFKLPARTQQVF